jgi:hypothetical protein
VVPFLSRAKDFSTETFGSTQFSLEWVPEALFPMVKQPGCEPDHSPLSIFEVKNDRCLSLLTLNAFMKCTGTALVFICVKIQDDSEGKFNILRGDSIGHCEKKVHMNMCVILNGYRDRAVLFYK